MNFSASRPYCFLFPPVSASSLYSQFLVLPRLANNTLASLENASRGRPCGVFGFTRTKKTSPPQSQSNPQRARMVSRVGKLPRGRHVSNRFKPGQTQPELLQATAQSPLAPQCHQAPSAETGQPLAQPAPARSPGWTRRTLRKRQTKRGERRSQGVIKFGSANSGRLKPEYTEYRLEVISLLRE
ncbi:hypothetical protein BDFG_04376 [Blastomyces dermatitidis ATCC 26199]|nr:hypothetical protein BDFG_04376 [Blastomyces dermatitidis ATCC 26199]